MKRQPEASRRTRPVLQQKIYRSLTGKKGSHYEDLHENPRHAHPVRLRHHRQRGLQLRGGHQTSTCGDDNHSNAEILARFKNADGSTSFYTICAEGGEVNGSAALTALTSASSNFYGTHVYTGTLDNGQRIMTVACINGNGAMTGTTADVRVPNDAVKGYDLYLVGSDGTETKLNVSSSSNSSYSVVRVNMQDGAALIRLVPQSNG